MVGARRLLRLPRKRFGCITPRRATRRPNGAAICQPRAERSPVGRSAALGHSTRPSAIPTVRHYADSSVPSGLIWCDRPLTQGGASSRHVAPPLYPGLAYCCPFETFLLCASVGTHRRKKLLVARASQSFTLKRVSYQSQVPNEAHTLRTNGFEETCLRLCIRRVFELSLTSLVSWNNSNASLVSFENSGY